MQDRNQPEKIPNPGSISMSGIWCFSLQGLWWLQLSSFAPYNIEFLIMLILIFVLSLANISCLRYTNTLGTWVLLFFSLWESFTLVPILAVKVYTPSQSEEVIPFPQILTRISCSLYSWLWNFWLFYKEICSSFTLHFTEG